MTHPLRSVGCISILAVSSACRKAPEVTERYYSLVLEAAEDAPPPKAPPHTSAPRVYIEPVVLPDFLRTRSLVLQVGSNELRPARYHHWGEPLDVSIRKVLTQDLAQAHPGLQVGHTHRDSAACTLTVDFDRFHATTDARVVVSGRYTLVREDTVQQNTFDVTQVQRGDGYTHAVKAMRRAVAELTTTLADAVAPCERTPETADSP